MNCAFMLLTAAGLVGGDASCASCSAAPAIVSTGSSCGGGCSSCSTCETSHDPCCKPSFFARFRGMFAKSSCCEPVCETSCCAAPAPAPTACCKPAPVCCQPAPVCPPPCCDPCDSGCKPGFFARLKARFSKSDCCEPTCCDGGCGSSYAAAPAVISHPAPAATMPAPAMPAPSAAPAAPAAPGAEPIPAPKEEKKMTAIFPTAGNGPVLGGSNSPF